MTSPAEPVPAVPQSGGESISTSSGRRLLFSYLNGCRVSLSPLFRLFGALLACYCAVPCLGSQPRGTNFLLRRDLPLPSPFFLLFVPRTSEAIRLLLDHPLSPSRDTWLPGILQASNPQIFETPFSLPISPLRRPGEVQHQQAPRRLGCALPRTHPPSLPLHDPPRDRKAADSKRKKNLFDRNIARFHALARQDDNNGTKRKNLLSWPCSFTRLLL